MAMVVHDLLLILAAGLFAGVVCKWLRVPTLIGYMLVGVAIGGGGMGLVAEPHGEIAHLAEVGVFFLLFAIGLEFSLDELLRLGRHLLVGGSTQMVLVALPVAGGLAWAGVDVPTAVLLASGMAFSSTVLVFRTLAEWGQTSSVVGRRVIGILLFQDAALVPLLLFAPLLTGGRAPGWLDFVQLTGASATFIGSVVLLRWILGRWLISRLAGYRSPELVVLATLVLLGGVTWFAHAIGLATAVGAFAAGLMLSANRWTPQIDALIMPFRETFAAIFFVSLGMLLESQTLWQRPLLVAGLAVVLILIKGVAATIALRLTRLSWRTSSGMGLGLAHVGEFAFVLVALGAETAVVSESHVQPFVAVSLISLMLSPLFLTLGLRLARDTAMVTEARDDRVLLRDGGSKRALVVGMGPIGRRIASQLETTGYDACLIDRSPLNLHAFAQQGFRTIAGDANDPDVLDRAGASQVTLAAICIPEDSVALQLVRRLRDMSPSCTMLVRCRYLANVPKLTKAGADHVISEEELASRAILSLLASEDDSTGRTG
jgi:CPA2 family monovalent cation:H+ antiporter-2